MSVGTRDGGKPEKKDLAYSPPQGPTSQYQSGPGLHGVNTGVNNNTIQSNQSSGSPGLHGSNHGNNGTQGQH